MKRLLLLILLSIGLINSSYAASDIEVCKSGYYSHQSAYDMKWACKRLPENALAVSSSLGGFYCNVGYKKSGNKCKKEESFVFRDTAVESSFDAIPPNSHLLSDSTLTEIEDWKSFSKVAESQIQFTSQTNSILLKDGTGENCGELYGSIRLTKTEPHDRSGDFKLIWICPLSTSEEYNGSYQLTSSSVLNPEIQLNYFYDDGKAQGVTILNFDFDKSKIKIKYAPFQWLDASSYKIISKKAFISGGWECNDGFKKSANKCINKINKLVVPSYRN